MTFRILSNSFTSNIKDKSGDKLLFILVAYSISICIACQKVKIALIYQISIDCITQVAKYSFTPLPIFGVQVRNIITNNKIRINYIWPSI